ncbi:hypothetical protein [Sphingomonas sp. OTU376]|uniref:hypothetical protein n=1 Tax=Sphingomonas sp. OTU376 TaxID=3043863 RepID=UPI00313ACA93
MALMDLRGAVPNCGAHRIAWVIGTAPDPRMKYAELEVKLGPNSVERLLAGDLTPGASMGSKIFVWSNGRITYNHFYQNTPKRWRDAPFGFRAPTPKAPVMLARDIVRVADSARRVEAVFSALSFRAHQAGA